MREDKISALLQQLNSAQLLVWTGWSRDEMLISKLNYHIGLSISTEYTINDKHNLQY